MRTITVLPPNSSGLLTSVFGPVRGASGRFSSTFVTAPAETE